MENEYRIVITDKRTLEEFMAFKTFHYHDCSDEDALRGLIMQHKIVELQLRRIAELTEKLEKLEKTR